jgi:RNA polymerase sigma-70 factor (ECF subfamily)
MMDERTYPRLTQQQAARFERLAVPYLAVLLRSAAYLARDQQQAEDLVQETMIKAMRAIDQFQDGTEMKAWLLTILRRCQIDAVRRDRHCAQMVSIEQAGIDAPDASDMLGQYDEDWTNPAELMERFGDADVIDALKELPEDLRWTLLLVDVEQLDHSVAANVLDVPVGTVKNRAHRGRAMLRDRLFSWARDRGWVPNRESSHA